MATLSQLAEACGGKIENGDSGYEISNVSSLGDASKDSIAPFHHARYVKELATSKAGALISRGRPEGYTGRILEVADPQLALALIMPLLYPIDDSRKGVTSSASVADNVAISGESFVGENVVIDGGCSIGSGVKICSGVYIGKGVTIGANTEIGPNCTIYANSKIGESVRVSAGAVIGAEGFGYVPYEKDGAKCWVKMMHIGKVIVGDHVEIGSNTTIDRGSISDTLIEDQVIIDNLVQVAHNVKIGRATAIAACTAIAGSTTIGERCLIGGRVAIVGHITICDDVTIYADSLVTKSISKPGVHSSSLPAQPLKLWHRTLANMRRAGLNKRNKSN